MRMSRKMSAYRRITASTIAILASICVLGSAFRVAHAATLHGCVADNCTENAYGVVSIASPSLPNFEFTSSSSSGTQGTLFIDILVPDNVVGGNALNFSIKDGSSSPVKASLFEPTAWTSGNLASYLNISASPTNPIGNYDSLSGRTGPVSGFYVYQADLGTNTLAKNSTPNGSPQLSLIGSLPEDSYLLAFLETTITSKKGKTTESYSATANSGAIFEDTPLPATPLPAALPLFASGLGALGLLGWRRKRKASAIAAA